MKIYYIYSFSALIFLVYATWDATEGHVVGDTNFV